MGTSSSFGGSGGKAARDLRDRVAAWLDGPSEPGPARPEGESGTGPDSEPSDAPEADTGSQRLRVDLRPVLRMLRGSQGGGGGNGGGGAAAPRGGGRSSGGVRRSVGRISSAAGRAGRLALAYTAADQVALREAGLNYQELQALGDSLEVGRRIVEAAFEFPPDNTIAAEEERTIVATVVAWILESPEDQAPTPEEVVRKTIETTIAEVALTEVVELPFSKGLPALKRADTERQIRSAAAELAAQATLSPAGATAREIAQAIESGVRDLTEIFGEEP